MINLLTDYNTRCLEFEREIKPLTKKMDLGGLLAGLGFLATCGAIITEAKPLEEILIVGGVSGFILGLPLIYANVERISQISEKYFGV